MTLGEMAPDDPLETLVYSIARDAKDLRERMINGARLPDDLRKYVNEAWVDIGRVCTWEAAE